jgi:hypothetical protein
LARAAAALFRAVDRGRVQVFDAIAPSWIWHVCVHGAPNGSIGCVAVPDGIHGPG